MTVIVTNYATERPTLSRGKKSAKEWTDEEVAREVLSRAGEGSLRKMAARVPVSRETLRKWQSGEYTMPAANKGELVAWLQGEKRGPGYVDAAEHAERIVEEALEKIRAMKLNPPSEGGKPGPEGDGPHPGGGKVGVDAG